MSSPLIRTPSLGRASEVSKDAPATRHEPHRAALLEVGPSRDHLLKRLLALADALTALAAVVALALMVPHPLAVAFWASTSVPLWLLLAKLHGLYERDARVLHHLTVDELPSIAALAVSGTAGMAAGSLPSRLPGFRRSCSPRSSPRPRARCCGLVLAHCCGG